MRLSSRAPSRRHLLLHHGRIVRVYRAVIDGARAAQADGWRLDVDAACRSAEQALVWLDAIRVNESMRQRLTLRYAYAHPPFDAAS